MSREEVLRDSDDNTNPQTRVGSSRSSTVEPKRSTSTTKQRRQNKKDTLDFPSDPRPWHTRTFAYQYKPFRGMWADVKRRLPFYASDWTAAFLPHNLERTFGATIRMYFLNIFPALAYILDLTGRTNGAYGVNEAILASALAAIVFPVIGVQPLTIVGVTGLISLMSYTTYNIIHEHTDYLQFMAWTLIWSAISHWLVAIFNICDYTRFITDCTSETFGFYVATIYIIKGVELLVDEFKNVGGTGGWFSVVVAILFALSVYFMERTSNLHFGPFWLRRMFIDYSFAICIVFYTGFVHIPGYIKSSGLELVPITRSWYPTLDRDWVIPFWRLPVKWVFAALPFGLLITLLFYFDSNVSSVGAQARVFPVRRPAGFHWDFFLLGCVVFVSGLIGLPAPNALVPQAIVHTEALSETKMVSADAPLTDGGFLDDSDDYDPKAKEPVLPMKVVRTRVVEQRVSHLAMGLLTLGSMTRPILVCIGLMSRAMFAGVFIIVGWGSLEGNGIVHKTLFLLRDPRMTPRDHPLLGVRKKSIAYYIGVQWLVFAICVALSQTIAGIGFPVVIILLIPIRHFWFPKFIPPEELQILDAPTADSRGVLVSIGGPLSMKSEDDAIRTGDPYHEEKSDAAKPQMRRRTTVKLEDGEPRHYNAGGYRTALQHE